LSDLFTGRQALRHHAEGEQDRLDYDGDDQQGQDGFVAMATVERCVPGRYCLPCAPGATAAGKERRQVGSRSVWRNIVRAASERGDLASRARREKERHVSSPSAKTPADLFDDFIKLGWQDIFRTEVDVRLDNNSRYVPNGGSQGVSLLRKGVNAFDEALRIWSASTDEPEGSTTGYDRIVEQAGVEYTWEWFLIDPSRPWASAVPPLIRERIKADLDRRDRNAASRGTELAQEAERLAEAKDNELIASMNVKRLEQGKQPLSEQQEAMVRQSLVSRRAQPS
jgi:hypothetical protein